jgi:hypothetical protein
VKVSIEEIKKDEAKSEPKQDYPVLKMTPMGDVIFFIAKNSGICVKSGKSLFVPSIFQFAEYSNKLNEENFSTLKESVVIDPNDFDKEQLYPCIKKSKLSDSQVFFLAKEIGISLKNGELTNQWDEEKFEPIESKITLSND